MEVESEMEEIEYEQRQEKETDKKQGYESAEEQMKVVIKYNIGSELDYFIKEMIQNK